MDGVLRGRMETSTWTLGRSVSGRSSDPLLSRPVCFLVGCCSRTSNIDAIDAQAFPYVVMLVGRTKICDLQELCVSLALLEQRTSSPATRGPDELTLRLLTLQRTLQETLLDIDLRAEDVRGGLVPLRFHSM